MKNRAFQVRVLYANTDYLFYDGRTQRTRRRSARLTRVRRAQTTPSLLVFSLLDAVTVDVVVYNLKGPWTKRGVIRAIGGGGGREIEEFEPLGFSDLLRWWLCVLCGVVIDNDIKDRSSRTVAFV